MDASGKTSGTKSNPNQQFRETTEKATTQARQSYDQLAAATTEGSAAFETSYSTAIKGMRDYNAKVAEFAHANTTAAFEFLRRLSAVKSPTEFADLSSEQGRKQFEALTNQSKQLFSLTQNASLAAVEPIKAGMSKAFNRTA